LARRIFYFLSNSNLLKAERSATLVHMKYTRETLIYRERRAKLKKLSEIKKGQAIERYCPCIKGMEQLLLLSPNTPH
jgi:hypothetical protein